MSNTLIRDAAIFCLILSGGVYGFVNRADIYNYIGVSPQDIVDAREASRERAQNLDNQTTHKGAQSRVPKVTTARMAPSSTTIKKSEDGQFWTQAKVNNTHIKFLIDTGASVVVLTPEDARQAGLRPDDLDYDVQINTAAGRVMAAQVELSNVAVGNVIVYNVRAVIIPKGLTHSLLGMSYLGELQKLEVSPEELILRQ